MDRIDEELLSQIADLHGVPEGSYNIRKNGQSIGRASNDDIQIVSKKNKSGIDIFVKPNVKNKSVHIPVIITVGGLDDVVYNDFYIGENADVLIVAGCGIHNSSDKKSQHDGIHTFHLEKNSKVRYIERHLGLGDGAEKVLNPITKVYQKEGSSLLMETTQLGGVSSAVRKTIAKVGENATLVIKEKILTTDSQTAVTNFKVELEGKNSSVDVISRSVAQKESRQEFHSNVLGKNACFGHVECDGIITDKAQIASVPKIVAENVEASLVHEAAIGKIAGDQLTKLMSLGLDADQAEALIIKGFLA